MPKLGYKVVSNQNSNGYNMHLTESLHANFDDALNEAKIRNEKLDRPNDWHYGNPKRYSVWPHEKRS